MTALIFIFFFFIAMSMFLLLENADDGVPEPDNTGDSGGLGDSGD